MWASPALDPPYTASLLVATASLLVATKAPLKMEKLFSAFFNSQKSIKGVMELYPKPAGLFYLCRARNPATALLPAWLAFPRVPLALPGIPAADEAQHGLWWGSCFCK